MLKLLIFRCEYDRLENVLKSTVEGLVYLKYLKNIIKKQILVRIQDDIPLNTVICNVLIRLVRDYHQNRVLDKQLFSGVPQLHLKEIEKVDLFLFLHYTL